MRIDALVVHAMAGELQERLRGARVETVTAPTPLSIAVECYGLGQKTWILLSAHPQLGRVHALQEKPRKLVTEPSMFVMLLRKHLDGARIDAVRAVPWERIVRITFGRGPTVPPVTVIAEVMGNLANIILINTDDVILGAIRPVPLSINHYRAILPNHPYIPPPAQTRVLGGETLPRLRAEEVIADDLIRANQEPDGPTWRVLSGHLAGFTPDLAREAICQALADPHVCIPDDQRAAWEKVALTVRAIADRAAHDQWQPGALMTPDGVMQEAVLWPPCRLPSPDLAFAPIPSVNELLATYFAAREFRDALGSNAADLRRALKTARERLERKLLALAGDLRQMDQADQLRAEGELLLVYSPDIPERATQYLTPDLGGAMNARTITLDPRLSAIENANARFARYHKLRRAALQIPPQIERAKLDLALIAQIQTDLDLADTLADMVQVRAEIADARLGQIDRPKEPKRPPKKSGKAGKGGKPVKPTGGEPLKYRSADGLTILVGKNSRQNEYVTFDLATSNDLWLHARGVPGAHVIIKSGGRPVPPQTLEDAAGLAAWYSQSRGNASVPIDVTDQRYVRHMKDGGPGMVIYARERTIPATPRDLVMLKR